MFFPSIIVFDSRCFIISSSEPIYRIPKQKKCPPTEVIVCCSSKPERIEGERRWGPKEICREIRHILRNLFLEIEEPVCRDIHELSNDVRPVLASFNARASQIIIVNLNELEKTVLCIVRKGLGNFNKDVFDILKEHDGKLLEKEKQLNSDIGKENEAYIQGIINMGTAALIAPIILDLSAGLLPTTDSNYKKLGELIAIAFTELSNSRSKALEYLLRHHEEHIKEKIIEAFLKAKKDLLLELGALNAEEIKAVEELIKKREDHVLRHLRDVLRRLVERVNDVCRCERRPYREHYVPERRCDVCCTAIPLRYE